MYTNTRVFHSRTPADAQDDIDRCLDKGYEIVSISTTPMKDGANDKPLITVVMGNKQRYEPSPDVLQWLHDSFTGNTSDERADKMIDVIRRHVRSRDNWEEIKEILL
jgi:hypothetical protein